MKKVVIASRNPVKIACIRRAFEKVFPGEKFDFSGVKAPSGSFDLPQLFSPSGKMPEAEGCLSIFLFQLPASPAQPASNCYSSYPVIHLSQIFPHSYIHTFTHHKSSRPLSGKPVCLYRSVQIPGPQNPENPFR